MKIKIKLSKTGQTYWAETVGFEPYTCATSCESAEAAEERLRKNIKDEKDFRPIEKEIEV